MTLGAFLSNALSTALVAGYVGLRAYDLYQYYTRREDVEQDDATDSIRQQQRQHQQLVRRHVAMSHGPVLFTYSSSEGTHVYHLAGDEAGFMSAAMETPLGIDLLNLQLGLLDRDFDERDYEMLLALDRDSSGRGAPISEEQLAALPQHEYRAASKQSMAGEGSSGYHRTLQEHLGGQGQLSDGGNRGSTSAELEAPTCSICLEQFADGDKVSALPCFHQFHAGCVEPWLLQQGHASTCPICKMAVFQSSA